ncbi:MAG: TIGR00730 family Rossman fold protein [Pseudomonadota bacterium]
MIGSVCVFCGSRSGADPAYAEAACALGTGLAEARMRLVYGAGDVGLMGLVAKAAQDAGGDTFGVIPTHLLEREVGKRDLNRLVITETMHERKKVMVMNVDAIVLLPGGAGSLDEFWEVLTWAQLGLHQKPIIIVNTNGYWSPLIALLDHLIAQDFADDSLKDLVTVTADVAGALAALSSAPTR